MKRRDFLKTLGYGAAVVSLPAIAKEKYIPKCATEVITEKQKSKYIEWKNFDPLNQYGNAIRFSDPEMKERTFIALKENMSNAIPPEYRNKIKFIYNDFGTYDETASLAWKYIP